MLTIRCPLRLSHSRGAPATWSSWWFSSHSSRSMSFLYWRPQSCMQDSRWVSPVWNRRAESPPFTCPHPFGCHPGHFWISGLCVHIAGPWQASWKSPLKVLLSAVPKPFSSFQPIFVLGIAPTHVQDFVQDLALGLVDLHEDVPSYFHGRCQSSHQALVLPSGVAIPRGVWEVSDAGWCGLGVYNHNAGLIVFSWWS